ncbi:MAG: hypothetical protein C0501_19655 [Isosphaera sp.]|nr:hypothetical protein [Isosphaera sp.]
MRTCLFLALAAFLAGPAATAQDPPKDNVPKPVAVFNQFRDLVGEGRYDVAANFLQSFLDSNPTDADLQALEKKYGSTVFQGLRNVPKWSDNPAVEKQARANVEEAVKRARAVNDKLLYDPARVAKYIRNLGATYEERVYAEEELRRTGDYAVPFLADDLRLNRDKDVSAAILALIPKLEPSTVGGWVAALDGLSRDQQYGVLRAIASRDDVLRLQAAAQTELSPTLWRVMARPSDEDPLLRALAEGLLNKFLTGGKAANRVPEAELVAAARRFYDHQARYGAAKSDPGQPPAVPVWAWDATNPLAPKLVKNDNVPQPQADEYYGLRYARWALETKPNSEPAQSLILAIATERAVERARFGDLARAEPAVSRLLSEAPSGVLIELLNRGLAQKKTALAVGVIQALGDRGDKAAAPVLVRALSYPDPQVQVGAANALLRSPAPVPPEARGKIVDILRRAAAADPGASPGAVGTALFADPNPFRANTAAGLLRGLGYDVEVFATGRDLLRRVARASDFDIVLIDRHAPNPELIDLVGQLQGDARGGGRPTFVVASADKPPAPTFDQLVARFAALIAATENDPTAVPPAYYPDPKLKRTEDEAAADRRTALTNRDAAIATTVARRIDRLKRVIDATGLDATLTPSQRVLLDLRVQLVTYAVLAAEHPISADSAPGTETQLTRLRRQLALQPAVATYGAGLPTTALLKLLDRFEIDLGRAPEARKRFEAVYARIDLADLGIPVESFRDPALEAKLAKALGNYPAVRVVPELYGPSSLVGELQAAGADPNTAPRDPAARRAAQRVAVEWLRRMATGELPGFEVKVAEAELRDAIRADDLADAAVDALARFGSAEAQQALLGLALNAGRPLPLRVRAADAAVRHVQVNGRAAGKALTDPLTEQAAKEPDPALRGKLQTLKGLLVSDPGGFTDRVKGYNPPLVPLPPPKEGPKEPKEPKDPAP